MRIAIVGAGALGLYYGALLQRSGEDVHFLLRRDYDAVTRHGLRVFSINGDFTLPHVRGYRTPDEIGPVDLVLVGLKTFANDRFPELVGPLAGKCTQGRRWRMAGGRESGCREWRCWRHCWNRPHTKRGNLRQFGWCNSRRYYAENLCPGRNSRASGRRCGLALQLSFPLCREHVIHHRHALDGRRVRADRRGGTGDSSPGVTGIACPTNYSI